MTNRQENTCRMVCVFRVHECVRHLPLDDFMVSHWFWPRLTCVDSSRICFLFFNQICLNTSLLCLCLQWGIELRIFVFFFLFGWLFFYVSQTKLNETETITTSANNKTTKNKNNYYLEVVVVVCSNFSICVIRVIMNNVLFFCFVLFLSQ